MFNLINIIYVIVLSLAIIVYTNTITLWSYLIGQNRKGGEFAKTYAMWLLDIFYQKGLKSTIYFSGKYENTDKIDVIISNHIHPVDFIIQSSIHRNFDKKPIFFILQKKLVFFPGIGFSMCSALDIKLNRKIEDDLDNLVTSIRKIKNGIIVIMPEGTRFTPEKRVIAQKYSRDNNLPIFKNTLFPKMKGMWLICNILTNENRMGNIIDLTLMVENYKHQKIYTKQLLSKKLGNTLCVINNYTTPAGIIQDYDIFKKWFLDIWKIKDNILVNMYTENDTNIYTKLNNKVSTTEYSIAVFLIILFTYLMIKTKGRYLGYSLIISYIITFIRYKLLKKKL